MINGRGRWRKARSAKRLQIPQWHWGMASILQNTWHTAIRAKAIGDMTASSPTERIPSHPRGQDVALAKPCAKAECAPCFPLQARQWHIGDSDRGSPEHVAESWPHEHSARRVVSLPPEFAASSGTSLRVSRRVRSARRVRAPAYLLAPIASAGNRSALRYEHPYRWMPSEKTVRN